MFKLIPLMVFDAIAVHIHHTNKVHAEDTALFACCAGMDERQLSEMVITWANANINAFNEQKGVKPVLHLSTNWRAKWQPSDLSLFQMLKWLHDIWDNIDRSEIEWPSFDDRAMNDINHIRHLMEEISRSLIERLPEYKNATSPFGDRNSVNQLYLLSSLPLAETLLLRLYAKLADYNYLKMTNGQGKVLTIFKGNNVETPSGIGHRFHVSEYNPALIRLMVFMMILKGQQITIYPIYLEEQGKVLPQFNGTFKNGKVIAASHLMKEHCFIALNWLLVLEKDGFMK